LRSVAIGSAITSFIMANELVAIDKETAIWITIVVMTIAIDVIELVIRLAVAQPSCQAACQMAS
jgi:hypothetical protein